MYLFLRQLLFFVLILIPLIFTTLAFVFLRAQPKAQMLQLPDSVTTIFVGDSHIQKGVYEGLIPNSRNLGASAEAYYFSYFKLKHLLKTNPHIEQVFLGYSYHNLSDYYDDFVYGKLSKAVSHNYFLVVPAAEQKRLLKANKHRLFSFIAQISENNVGVLFFSEFAHLGKFENTFLNTTMDTSIMQKRVHTQYYTNQTNVRQYSPSNIKYLKKITLLCKTANVKLTLLNIPLHPTYVKKVPEKFKTKYQQLIHELNVSEIDLSQLPLDSLSYIPDGDHVSRWGALATAKKLREHTGL